MKYAIMNDNVDLYRYLLDKSNKELFHEDLRSRYPFYHELERCGDCRTMAFTVLSIEHNARKIIKQHTIFNNFYEAYVHTPVRKFDIQDAIIDDPELESSAREAWKFYALS